jgi:hypothetical protein
MLKFAKYPSLKADSRKPERGSDNKRKWKDSSLDQVNLFQIDKCIQALEVASYHKHALVKFLTATGDSFP